jgi:hypothetical protein
MRITNAGREEMRLSLHLGAFEVLKGNKTVSDMSALWLLSLDLIKI